MTFENLLVTGGCGFIGSNFIGFSWTARISPADRDFDNSPTQATRTTWGVAERYHGRYVFEHGDVCDAGRLEDLFGRYGIDGVCHFAAESHVDRSIRRPESFIQRTSWGPSSSWSGPKPGGPPSGSSIT